MAHAVDHVSNGRLELGFGAGWFVPEHERFGIEFLPPGERVAQFREAVEIVDSLLRNETTTFAGRYYQLDGAYVRPAPVQKPRPPLTLGAHRTRMLRICAEYADGPERVPGVGVLGARSAASSAPSRRAPAAGAAAGCGRGEELRLLEAVVAGRDRW